MRILGFAFSFFLVLVLGPVAAQIAGPAGTLIVILAAFAFAWSQLAERALWSIWRWILSDREFWKTRRQIRNLPEVPESEEVRRARR